MELVEEMSAMWGLIALRPGLIRMMLQKSNTQIWARDLRYTMFRDLKRELNADFIVTAHHRDDQVETILQKYLRGSGPGAWSGMSLLDGDLFRPLLMYLQRRESWICRNQHVPFRDDQTNQTSKYARNLIRNDLARA